MKKSNSKFWVLVLLPSLLINFAVAADKKQKNSEHQHQHQYQCQLISKGEAIKQAKSRMKGKVVGVQLSEKDEYSVYRVRVLVDNKRIKTISIQACR